MTDFADWLQEQLAAGSHGVTGDHITMARAVDPIKGGRFIRAMKTNLCVYPLWPLMQCYMKHYNFAKDGEDQANKLAQAVTVYLEQPFRPLMVRAVALLYADFFCPTLHQHKHDDDVLATGQLWRRIKSALVEVVGEGGPEAKALARAELLQRIRARERILKVEWTFPAQNMARQKAHTICVDAVRVGREDSTDEGLAAAISYLLVHVSAALDHYARDHFLPNGRLHPDNIGGHEADALERCKAHSVNSFVESMFAYVDAVGRHRSETISSSTATMLAMCKTDGIQECFDNLSCEEKAVENSNAAAKMASLVAQTKARKKRAHAAGRERKQELEAKGRARVASQVQRAADAKANIDRIASEADLDGILQAAGSVRGQEAIFEEQFKLYRDFYAKPGFIVQHGESAGEPFKKAAREDGKALYTFKVDGKAQSTATYRAKLLKLIGLSAGSAGLGAAGVAKARGIAKDHRTISLGAMDGALAAVGSNPALAKTKKGYAQQAARTATTIAGSNVFWVPQACWGDAPPDGFGRALADNSSVGGVRRAYWYKL